MKRKIIIEIFLGIYFIVWYLQWNLLHVYIATTLKPIKSFASNIEYDITKILFSDSNNTSALVWMLLLLSLLLILTFSIIIFGYRMLMKLKIEGGYDEVRNLFSNDKSFTNYNTNLGIKT